VEFLALLLTLVGLAGHQPSNRAESAKRVCFDKRLWSKSVDLRPCVQLIGLEEDGSFDARVTNAQGEQRYRVRVGNRAD